MIFTLVKYAKLILQITLSLLIHVSAFPMAQILRDHLFQSIKK